MWLPQKPSSINAFFARPKALAALLSWQRRHSHSFVSTVCGNSQTRWHMGIMLLFYSQLKLMHCTCRCTMMSPFLHSASEALDEVKMHQCCFVCAVGSRHHLTQTSVCAALHAQVRYTAVRRQGASSQTEREVQVLDYQNACADLLPQVAAAYALIFMVTFASRAFKPICCHCSCVCDQHSITQPPLQALLYVTEPNAMWSG